MRTALVLLTPACKLQLPELAQLLSVPHVQDPPFMHIAEDDRLVDRIARLHITVRKYTEHVKGKRTDLADALRLAAVAVILDLHALRQLHAVIGGQHALNIHAIRHIGEECVKLLILTLVERHVHDLQEELCLAPMRIEITQVLQQLLEIHTRLADRRIFLRGKPLQRHAQGVESRVDQCIGKRRTQHRGV